MFNIGVPILKVIAQKWLSCNSRHQHVFIRIRERVKLLTVQKVFLLCGQNLWWISYDLKFISLKKEMYNFILKNLFMQSKKKERV